MALMPALDLLTLFEVIVGHGQVLRKQMPFQFCPSTACLLCPQLLSLFSNDSQHGGWVLSERKRVMTPLARGSDSGPLYPESVSLVFTTRLQFAAFHCAAAGNHLSLAASLLV